MIPFLLNRRKYVYQQLAQGLCMKRSGWDSNLLTVDCKCEPPNHYATMPHDIFNRGFYSTQLKFISGITSPYKNIYYIKKRGKTQKHYIDYKTKPNVQKNCTRRLLHATKIRPAIARLLVIVVFRLGRDSSNNITSYRFLYPKKISYICCSMTVGV